MVIDPNLLGVSSPNRLSHVVRSQGSSARCLEGRRTLARGGDTERVRSLPSDRTALSGPSSAKRGAYRNLESEDSVTERRPHRNETSEKQRHQNRILCCHRPTVAAQACGYASTQLHWSHPLCILTSRSSGVCAQKRCVSNTLPKKHHIRRRRKQEETRRVSPSQLRPSAGTLYGSTQCLEHLALALSRAL